MRSVRWLLSYIFVAVLGLWLAFAVSAKFMAPAHSQNAPANGDLPPEFLKEVESTQVPQQGASQKAPTKKSLDAQTDKKVIDALPSEKTLTENGQPNKMIPQNQPTVPPPPVAEVPIGDGATAVGGQTREILQHEDYRYDPTGKRDPFKVFRAIRSARIEVAKLANAMEALDPLQRWEIDRLQVVGILWDVRVPRAMVRDPDGTLYTITKNSKIGRNEGFVAAIREGEVVVIETKYEEGQAVKDTRIMELKK
ncbi:MAG: pilus assembly protein PilP [Pseudobdellovibrionaceae bacterium]